MNDEEYKVWYEKTRDRLAKETNREQALVVAIRASTEQCFALIQERDELQKQVWRYEKNGVTCQTYRHKVDASCAECNVNEVYTSPPAQREWVGLDEHDFDVLFLNEDGIRFAKYIEAKLKEKNDRQDKW